MYVVLYNWAYLEMNISLLQIDMHRPLETKHYPVFDDFAYRLSF